MSHSRRPNSLRLRGYDYKTLGAYFVTLCSHERRAIFGEIRRGIMGLSDLGSMVVRELQKSVDMRREIELDVWMLMPNHLHLVVFVVGVDGIDPSPTNVVDPGARHAPLQWSVPSFVAGFKSATTKYARMHHGVSLDQSIWQRNYHDHIIRDESSLARIRDYVMDNPTKWNEDEYFSKSVI